MPDESDDGRDVDGSDEPAAIDGEERPDATPEPADVDDARAESLRDRMEGALDELDRAEAASDRSAGGETGADGDGGTEDADDRAGDGTDDRESDGDNSSTDRSGSDDDDDDRGGGTSEDSRDGDREDGDESEQEGEDVGESEQEGEGDESEHESEQEGESYDSEDEGEADGVRADDRDQSDETDGSDDSEGGLTKVDREREAGPIEPEKMPLRGWKDGDDPTPGDMRMLDKRPAKEPPNGDDETADGQSDRDGDDSVAADSEAEDAEAEDAKAEDAESEGPEADDAEAEEAEAREGTDADRAAASESEDDRVSDEPDADPPKAQTDGEGYVRDRNEPGEPTYPDPDEDVGGISTPPDDEEMPLADHIEEMILRLAVVLLVGSAGTAIGLLWASEAIGMIWLDVFPGVGDEVPPPHVYHPLELWLTRIKVAALLGVMVALPMFVYETYLFMRPGLYPHERRYYLAAVPTSVVLAAIGMVFSYYLVLPVLFRYFTFYSEGSANIAYALGETFNLIITLTGFLAIVFQIPLFIMLAIMMGVTTRQWLADKRLYFWGAFAVLAFTFTFDPTLMAAILVAITMIALFEGTLLLLKWTGRE